MVSSIGEIVHKEIESSVSYGSVDTLPRLGIYHTEAESVFNDYDAFIKWVKARKQYDEKAPWIGLTLFASSLIEGQVETYDYIIQRLEDEGFNVLPAFGRVHDVLTTLLMDENRKSRVDLILAFSLKFYSALNEKTNHKSILILMLN